MNAPAGSARQSLHQRQRSRRPFVIAWLLRNDDRSVAYAALSGAVLVVLLGIPLAIGLNAWIDEAFTMHSTGHGVAYALREANDFEVQPPLYFILEAAWRELHESSIAFGRIPSIFFAATAVAILVAAAGQIAPRIPPFAVAAVTALNPLVLWAASEMRVYALVFCIGSVLAWTYYAGFLNVRRSRPAQIAYVVFAVAGLYTQYYVGFLLVAHGVTLVLLRREALRDYAVSMAAVAAAFAPFMPTVIKQTAVGTGFLLHAPLQHVVHDVAVNVLVYALPHDRAARGTLKAVTVGLTGLVFALVIFAQPGFASNRDRDFTVAGALCVLVFCTLFAFAGVPDVRRHVAVIAPSTILVSLLLIGSLQRRIVPIGVIVFGVYLVLASTALWADYSPPAAKSGDWKRVALTVSGSIPVAVFPAELAVPLSLYRSGPIVSIPRPMPFSGDYIVATRVPNVGEVARVLDPVRARWAQLWLVTPSRCVPETPGYAGYHCQYVVQYLAQHYRFVRSVQLKDTLVELYERLHPGA